ncbi:MmgE/PrpD family protein [Klebsiella pneumoniae]|uniref:MmgE/PrpD family protein n=1 Tax=Klebsiella pneumoniae TaxID=573 RepID=UPI002D78F6F6|nr:MmgE/PrpD family protein [Klebsiella pneumoniae]WRP72386.1 MmgE/PrpD family protein [Klebsiella pneumoniae]
MTMMLTRELGEMIASARQVPPGDDALHYARRDLIDTLAVMLAGRNEDTISRLVQTQRLLAEDTPPDILAFALQAGAAAHVLDYDNVALGGHPAAVLIPALLALARRFPLSGRALLVAYATGYEAWGELRRRHPVLAHAAGWHPSGLIGPIAAAAACASALELDAVRARHALAIAASQSAGLMANFGTPVKALHIGFAAKAGLFAALLARQGITGNDAILEQERGWLTTWSPHHPADRTTALALRQQDWLLARQPAAIKYYPVCYAAHRIVDAARQLYLQTAARRADIARIRLMTSQRHSDILRFRKPMDHTQSAFSLEFVAASALIDGELTPGSLQDKKRACAEVWRLMACCERIVIAESDPEREGFAPQDRIEIVFHQGDTLFSPPVRYATGDARSPLSSEQLQEKFIHCLRWGGVTENSHALWASLQNIEQLSCVDELDIYRLLPCCQ